jgi:hypothetical protein
MMSIETIENPGGIPPGVFLLAEIPAGRRVKPLPKIQPGKPIERSKIPILGIFPG